MHNPIIYCRSNAAPTAEKDVEDNLIAGAARMIIRYMESNTILVFDAVVSATAMPH